jgi:DNA polymerase III epsilon subunit-like protein
MFVFLDTETTGTEADDRLCQIAFKMDQGTIVNKLFDPGKPIAIEAMAVHHITNEMVRDKPPFKDSSACRQLTSLVSDGNNVVVAHNAQFDILMLNREGIHPPKVICTLKLARFLDKEGVIPQYNLQYLRYYLGLRVEATAHDALGDILVLEKLFHRIHAKFKKTGVDKCVDEMIRISNSPVLIPRMPYGKHKGRRFSEIPHDYLQWLLGTGLDEDLAHTVRHYLGAG